MTKERRESMKSYKVYQTSRGGRLYCTSHDAARKHIAKTMKDSETALWSGTEFAKPGSLYRAGRGVYRERRGV